MAASVTALHESVRSTHLFRFVAVVRDNALRTEEQKQFDDGPIELKFI